jgi:hypothetical protein
MPAARKESTPMKYMLLINLSAGTREYEQWAPDAWEAHLDYLRRMNRSLTESGELVDVLALTPPASARLVRAGAGGAPATDGPFAESKEFLAGFWVVDVDSPERACAIAAQGSAAPGPEGAPLNMPIEVRRVMTSECGEG